MPRVLHRVSGHKLIVWVRCDRSCRLAIHGYIRAIAGGTHRGAKVHFPPRRVSPPNARRKGLTIPPSLRRWLHRTPGPAHLQAKLRFVATDPEGRHDTVRRQVRVSTPAIPLPANRATPPRRR